MEERKIRDLKSEAHYKPYLDKTQDAISEQQSVIDDLKRCNEALKSELALESKQSKVSVDNKALERLQSQTDVYVKRIQVRWVGGGAGMDDAHLRHPAMRPPGPAPSHACSALLVTFPPTHSSSAIESKTWMLKLLSWRRRR